MSRRAFALLLSALPVLGGCGHIYHVPPDAPPWRPADTVPASSKARVHVFLFDAYDPLAANKLGVVRDHLHFLGFGKTYYGWPHHLSDFQLDLATVSADEPAARFAVVGYGSGAVAARKLAAFADAIGAPIEVAIYLEPPDLDESPGAMNTFTVTSLDLDAMDGTRGTFIDRHFRKADVPLHPFVQELVEREVTLIGLGVPVAPRKPAPPVVLVPPMPAPRATIPIPKELPPEWLFLRPRAPWLQLAPPPEGVEPLPLPRPIPNELPPPGKG